MRVIIKQDDPEVVVELLLVTIKDTVWLQDVSSASAGYILSISERGIKLANHYGGDLPTVDKDTVIIE